MKAPGLPADQQFFADLFSGLVLNPQLLGRVWFASQPASLPVGSLCIDFPRLDIVLRANTAICWKQSSNVWWKEKCCLFRHARLIYRSTTNR
mgnify:CR=1 FL=1